MIDTERLVTAIITTYKRTPDMVKRALCSVFSQTHSNIEIIVVDDSPADFAQKEDVRRMVESYAERGVTYLTYDESRGACAARNAGLAIAKGEFVGFLDDDDEWLPEKIEKQLAAFTSDEIALVYCGNILTNDATGETHIAQRRFEQGRVFDQLIYENFIGSTSFPLLRKSALLEIGGFDELMLSAQDYDVWLRLTQTYAVAYVAEPLCNYHVHPSERITKIPLKRISGQERLIVKNWEYLKRHKDAYWARLIEMAPMYASNKQLGKALGKWLKGVFKGPFHGHKNLRCLYTILRYYFS